MMTCGRAVALLRGLENNQLAGQAKEIDELLKGGLAIEADPLVYQALCRILALEAPFPSLQADPFSRLALSAELTEVEHKLKDEWHRLGTGKEKLKQEEAARVGLRYAVGQVSDPVRLAAFRKMIEDRALIPQGAMYVTCPQLGAELYAITHRGQRVRRELEVRLGRFEPVPLAVFLKSFDKTDAKMQSFVGEIGALSAQVGPVRKHRGQVLVGLTKSGMPPAHAAGVYKEALRQSSAPDVAVTCTRNASSLGTPQQVRAAGLEYRGREHERHRDTPSRCSQEEHVQFPVDVARDEPGEAGRGQGGIGAAMALVLLWVTFILVRTRISPVVAAAPIK